MRIVLLLCVSLILFGGCKKDADSRVDIYLLKSFSADVTQSGSIAVTSITNAVLSEIPLVADEDIEYYLKSQTTFKLKKDLRPLIKDYREDKAFAVTINHKPVYYGRFHPGYLSSLTIGVATIDPILYDGGSLQIGFINIASSPFLQDLDKRNDNKIISAFKASGRLR